MIDTATGRERNLKNIRQIGTPSEEDRIYIENNAYQRVHEQEYASRRVFIFMGHTECEQGRYTTFIEAAIPVRDIEFSQNIPRWDNRAWADIFHEIKRSYEDAIIVGWAVDIKGFVPRMSIELEEVHREHFGGAHQMILLMDSLEGEEYFYINKGSQLQKREGFYIYYCSQPKERQADVTVEFPQAGRRRGSFRQENAYALGGQEMRHSRRQPQEERPRHPEPRENAPVPEDDRRMYEPKREIPISAGGRKASSYAMTAAILLLIGIVGAGVYQDRIHLPGLKEMVATMSGGLKKGKDNDAEVLVGTERKEAADDTQTDAEPLDLIPVDEIPSGEVNSADNDEQAKDSQQTPSDNTDLDGKENDALQDAEENKTDGADSDAQGNETDGADNEAEGNKTDGADNSSGSSGEDASETDAEPERYYIVQKGDTLTAICREVYGSSDYMDLIVEKNNLEDSNDIRVGQKLLLP